MAPYEESGYQDLPIEWAFALEFDNAEDRFLRFILNEKGTRHDDECRTITTWLADTGWFEFADINNASSWLREFYDFKNQSQQELHKANANGMQISLF